LDPFGFTLPPPLGLLLPCEMRSLHETRCSTQPQNSPFVFEPPLPFRISRSFGIVALSPTPNSGACLCELPDLPSLPAALKIITYHHALRINVPDPLLPASATCRYGLQLTGVTQRAFIPLPSPALAGRAFAADRTGRLAATDSPALSGRAPGPHDPRVGALRLPRRRPIRVGFSVVSRGRDAPMVAHRRRQIPLG